MFPVSARTAMASASLLSLAIKQEVAEDATRTPEETICPALDAALVLIEDEDGARGDHLAFRVDETTSDTRDEAATGSFEDQKGIAGSLDPAGPGRFSPGIGGCVLRA